MALFIEKQLLPNRYMDERIEAYLLYEGKLSVGELDKSGNLTVGRKTYVAWGNIPTNIESSNGQKINIDHILVDYEDFEIIADELEANGIETKPF